MTDSGGITGDWRSRAACLHHDVGWVADIVNLTEAKAICATCPVRSQCLEHALLAGDYTDLIWGGLTGDERLELVQLARRVNSAVGC